MLVRLLPPSRSFPTAVRAGEANTSHSSNDTSRLFPCTSPFFIWPFFGPLLFENQTSDARDHCANERTFLSYLRLSIYMAIVSVAIVLSFHVKSQPSAAELAMARPLGVIFWLLSVACLLVGLGNYIGEFGAHMGRLCGDVMLESWMLTCGACVCAPPETVNKFSRKAAIVQSGFKTQIVSPSLWRTTSVKKAC